MLAALYDRIGATAYSLATRITGDRAVAEDLVASVFATVYEEAGSTPDLEDRVAARLLRLVRTRALAIRQADRAGAGAAATTEIPGQTSGDDSPAPSPGERERLAKALAALPEDTRQAIELVFYEGLTQSDLGVRLDLPVAAARHTVREGVTTLRDEMRLTS